VAKTHPVTVLFFIAYYFAGVMVVVNLITALMIEFYRASMAVSAERQEEQRLLVGQEVSSMLQESAVLAHFNARASPSHTQSMEKLRTSFLQGEGSDPVDRDLVKRIAQESSMDLVSLYDAKHSNDMRSGLSRSLTFGNGSVEEALLRSGSGSGMF